MGQTEFEDKTIHRHIRKRSQNSNYYSDDCLPITASHKNNMPTKKTMQQLARLLPTTLMPRRNIIDLLGEPSPPPKRKPVSNQRQMYLLNA